MNPAQSPATSGRRTLLLLASGVLLFAFGWTLAGGASVQAKTETKPADEKAAIINGQVVSMEEVNAKAKDRLLELEAKATGKTKEALLEEGVKAKAGTVGDADVDNYYEQLKAQQPQGLPAKEAVADRIKQYLQQQKDQNARNAFFTDLKNKYKVETFLTEPRIEIATEGHPAKGPASAPVTIVEFSDFECPFCKNVVPTLEQVKQKYGDQVRLVFRQFLLSSIHPHAQKAAEAALCANEQGKFWEMHDAMFGDQSKLEVSALKVTAGNLGVDKAKFDECLDSGRFAQRIKDDETAGSLVGVSGTPAIFINGRSFSGAQPYDALASAIDEEFAWAKNGKC
jgi:protein-disulfide isomerase